MTFTKTLFAASVASLLLAGTASAQVYDDGRGAYAGVGVSALSFDSYLLTGKAGYNLNEYFSFEGEGGFGISDENDNRDGFEIGAGVDYYLAGFARVQAPLTEQFDVFARGGYYFGQVDGDFTDNINNISGNVSADIDGFAFGAGGQFNFGPDYLNAIRLEYTNLDVQEIDDVDVDRFDLDSDLYTVSYIRKF